MLRTGEVRSASGRPSTSVPARLLGAGLSCRGGLSHYSHFSALPSQILAVNPPVGLLQANAQWRIRFPLEVFLDQRVIAVSTVHAFRRFKIVIALQLDACDFFRHVHKLVDGHRFARTQVDGLE